MAFRVPHKIVPSQRSSHSQLTLFAGFGGLLALMALAGFGAVRLLRQIQTSNSEIRREFVTRNATLSEMRSDLYLSGTYIRDYLLDPDPARAASHLENLNDIRAHIDRHLAEYRRMLRPTETGPLNGLEQELAGYWKVMDPVFGWTAEQRRRNGFAFLRDEILPRRAAMLNIADRIARVNEQQLSEGGRRVGDLFSGFRVRLLMTVGVTLA